MRQEPQQEYTQEKFASSYNLGVDRYRQGDYQGAIDAWTQALRINPRNTHAYYDRGRAKAALGDYRGAIEDFDYYTESVIRSRDGWFYADSDYDAYESFMKWHS